MKKEKSNAKFQPLCHILRRIFHPKFQVTKHKSNGEHTKMHIITLLKSKITISEINNKNTVSYIFCGVKKGAKIFFNTQNRN